MSDLFDFLGPRWATVEGLTEIARQLLLSCKDSVSVNKTLIKRLDRVLNKDNATQNWTAQASWAILQLELSLGLPNRWQEYNRAKSEELMNSTGGVGGCTIVLQEPTRPTVLFTHNQGREFVCHECGLVAKLSKTKYRRYNRDQVVEIECKGEDGCGGVSSVQAESATLPGPDKHSNDPLKKLRHFGGK